MSVSGLLGRGRRGDTRPERDAADVAGALRERIYASLTGVATLMLLILSTPTGSRRGRRRSA